MLYTKNDLPEKTRQNVTVLLQKHLSDGIDLMLQIKQAHWNVKGPNFIALHKLFDKAHEGVEECVDLLAERIAQLGEIAEGTCKSAAMNTTLPEYPLTITQSHEHLEALSQSLSVFGKSIRQGIEQAVQLQDMGTADILTKISRNSDKTLWFVESHIAPELVKEAGIRGVA